MTISLKPEQERIIQAEIDRGHFRSPDEVLDHALAALQERHRIASPPRKNLAQFLMESPLAGAELNLERQKDFGRPIDISAGSCSIRMCCPSSIVEEIRTRLCESGSKQPRLILFTSAC